MSIYLANEFYKSEEKNAALMKRKLKTLMPHRVVKRTRKNKTYCAEVTESDGKISEKTIPSDEYVNLAKDNIFFKLYRKELEYSDRFVRNIREQADEYQDQLKAISKYTKQLSSLLTPPRQILSFKPDSLSQRTKRGELVRSKSEGFIADGLLAHKIYYEYENPFLFKDILPDFYIPYNVRGFPIIWEHFGRLSSHRYLSEALVKLDKYAGVGFFVNYNLIVTCELYPTDSDPERYVFDSERAEKTINDWFEIKVA